MFEFHSVKFLKMSKKYKKKKNVLNIIVTLFFGYYCHNILKANTVEQQFLRIIYDIIYMLNFAFIFGILFLFIFS